MVEDPFRVDAEAIELERLRVELAEVNAKLDVLRRAELTPRDKYLQWAFLGFIACAFMQAVSDASWLIIPTGTLAPVVVLWVVGTWRSRSVARLARRLGLSEFWASVGTSGSRVRDARVRLGERRNEIDNALDDMGEAPPLPRLFRARGRR